MDREDIIRMAREAGMQGMLTDVVCTHEELARFAALVAEHERKKRHAAWHEGFEAGRKTERAFCAAICDEKQEVFEKYYTKGLAAMCAEAIRARSKQ